MSFHAIIIEQLSKRYQIGANQLPYQTLRETLSRAIAAPFNRLQKLSGRTEQSESFWALKDVSFNVGRGEVVGVIGRNGAGKSTLLKVLSQITEPTSGRIELNGRVASLLEVGTGFHPELTGRENIFLNGAILGMTRAEIKRKFDEIVAFAEIGKFLDTAVKYYSSGMYVRLAFAVAAHLEPEILIVDEVLAVGDAGFQRKCLGRMREAAISGVTVVFVSHDLAAIKRLCSRAILLSAGTLEIDDSAENTVDKYFRNLRLTSSSLTVPATHSRSGSGTVRITDLVFQSDDKQIISPQTGSKCKFAFRYKSSIASVRSHFAFGLLNSNAEYCLHCSSFTLDRPIVLNESGWIICDFDRLPLTPGNYYVNIKLDEENGQTIDYVQNAFSFDVRDGDFYSSGRLPNGSNGCVLVDYGFCALEELPRSTA